MSSINVFENNSDLYEEWFEENNDILDSEVEAIKCLLPPSGEGLEIGVGTGIFASRLGIKHGVEPAEKMREKAVDKGITVINAFAEDLPVENEKYRYAIKAAA